MTLTEIGRGDGSGVVDGYRSTLGVMPRSDELIGSDGAIRDGWQAFAETVDRLGSEGMRARGEQVRRLLEDDGVTYGGPTETGGRPGRWQLDPLPMIVGSQEWAELSPGLIQRAELFDRLLADLYGPRELLRAGIVPPEVVLGHAGFLRQCDGLRLPGLSQLVTASTDLVRRPDGWCALGDRTQAPSGAGYAMENRRIVSRVMPGLYRDTMLERLRSFFHIFRAALQDVAPVGVDVPRVVILTPGPASETSFDQAFLSTLLGFPLVEGEDLVVRDGRVWLRSLGRPERVDVVLRRVDGWFCDPLELRADSRLGVPGLLQAARLGNVSIVNPPGSGVLENPGLVPYLPAICETLLGAPILLPSAQTWWCGDPAGRSHVLSNLDALVIRPIARGLGRANRFGWELSQAERAELVSRIEAEPYAWCGQEALELSTTPVVSPAGLEPRTMVLRSFAVAEQGTFRLMSGGLGRVAGRSGSLHVSSQGGALAKDVWVLGARAVSTLPVPGPQARSDARSDGRSDGRSGAGSGLSAGVGAGTGTGAANGGSGRLGPGAGEEFDPVPMAPAMSSRVAEDMFWLGRYAERAEDAARLLRVAAELTVDHSRRPGSVGAVSLAVMLRALTGITTTFPGFIGDGAAERIADPQPELIRLAVDSYRPGTLAHAVRHTVEAANAVRELLSGDTWLVLGSLERELVELGRAVDQDLHLQATLSRVMQGLLALSGLAVESMVRDSGWYLMDAGRRIERAIQLTALMRHTLAHRGPAAVDDLVLESVLISAESVITYRRRNPGRPSVDDVLKLLLLEPGNPRGVQHQLDWLNDDLNRLPGPVGGGPAGVGDPKSRLRAIQALLKQTEIPELTQEEPGQDLARLVTRRALSDFLDRLIGELSALADAVARTHFPRAVPPQPMPATPTLDLR